MFLSEKNKGHARRTRKSLIHVSFSMAGKFSDETKIPIYNVTFHDAVGAMMHFNPTALRMAKAA